MSDVNYDVVEVETFYYKRGFIADSDFGSVDQGVFKSLGTRMVNRQLIETVRHHEKYYSTYERVVTPTTWFFGLLTCANISYKETKHPCEFYEHRMTSGYRVLTLAPLVEAKNNETE